MQQGNIILGLLAPADQDATEAIHPTMRPLHHPTTRLVACLPLHLLRGPLLGWQVHREVELFGDRLHLVIVIAQVQTQPLRIVGRRRGTLHGDTAEGFFDHLHIGTVGAVHGQSDGDALALGQQAALAALLGPVGGVFACLFPPRGVPWSCTRPCSARTNRCLSSRRRPSDHVPINPGRRRPGPILESGRGRWKRGRTWWRPELSIGSRYAARRGWPPCRRGRACGADRRRSGGCFYARAAAERWPPRDHPRCAKRPEWVVRPLLSLRITPVIETQVLMGYRHCTRHPVIRIGSKPVGAEACPILRLVCKSRPASTASAKATNPPAANCSTAPATVSVASSA